MGSRLCLISSLCFCQCREYSFPIESAEIVINLIKGEAYMEAKGIHEGSIVEIASFYPSKDFTIFQNTRRLSILRKDKGISAF